MRDKILPKKYKLCSRLSKEDLAAVCWALATEKDRRYIKSAKKCRIKKKYVDRVLFRAEKCLHFIISEAKKRGGFDFAENGSVVMLCKKNSFIGFRVVEDGQNNSFVS